MTFSRFLILTLSFFLASSPFAHATDEWKVTELTFLTLAQGDKIQGQFKSTLDSIYLDFDDISHAAVEVRININSLSIKKATDRELLLSPEFFDAERHKQARFVSASLKKISDNTFLAEGSLSIRGISRAISLPFERQDNNTIVGHTVIDRRWFGIGRGSWESKQKISHSVQIRFTLSRQQ